MSKVDFNINERLDSADLNAIGDVVERTVWQELLEQLTQPAVIGGTGAGVLRGLGFALTGGTGFTVAAGAALVDVTPTGAFDGSRKPAILTATHADVIPLNTTGVDRTDIVVIAPGHTSDTPSARQILTGGTLTPTTVNKRLLQGAAVTVVTGTTTAPAGTIKIGAVANLAASGGLVDLNYVVPVTERLGVTVFGGQSVPPEAMSVASPVPNFSVGVQSGAGVSRGLIFTLVDWKDSSGKVFDEALWNGGAQENFAPKYMRVTVYDGSTNTPTQTITTNSIGATKGTLGRHTVFSQLDPRALPTGSFTVQVGTATAQPITFIEVSFFAPASGPFDVRNRYRQPTPILIRALFN